VFAVTDGQLVAEECIKESTSLMNTLSENNFTTLRINDTISKASQLYDAQLYLSMRGSSAKFETVVEYCNEAKTVYNLAIDAKDAYDVFMNFYDIGLQDVSNKDSVDVIIEDINKEMKAERYERVLPLIDRGYQEIAAVQKRESTLNTFYGATTRGLKVFFLKTWKGILIGLGIFLVIFFLYGTAIRRYMVKRKIKRLEGRRFALKEYLKKTQRQYFEIGNLSESEYDMRSKNFAEMVRDIDRQIPLLNEKLVKYSNFKNDKKNNEDDSKKGTQGSARTKK
jgi:hypothetical protein